MKKVIMVIMVIASLCLVSGCGQPALDFAAGFGTGVVAKLNEANKAMEALDADIGKLNERSKELEILIEKDPIILANALDPNLGGVITEFMVNLKGLESSAREFEDKEGEVDWERLLMAAGISLFGGWNGKRFLTDRTKDGA